MEAESPHVLRLPVELQTEIISYCTSRRDLKALCSACNELANISRPLLYRDVVLRISALGPALSAQLHADNPGLHHIRTVDLREHWLVEGMHLFSNEEHGPSLDHLIRTLPRDVLRSFRLDTVVDLPDTTMKLLQSRQANLRNRQLCGPTSATGLHPAGLAQLLSVQIYINVETDCENALQLLKAAPNITSVEICVSTREPHAAWKYGADLLKRMFGVTDRSPGGQVHAKPRHLRLRGLRFARYHGIEGGQVDCLGHVEKLVLEHCKNSSTLFAAFQKRQHKLRSIANMHYTGESLDEHRLHELLTSSEGLEALGLSKGDTAAEGITCDYSAITKHGSTLRRLFLDDYEPAIAPFSEYGRGTEAFEAMCKACSRLQQLAIWAPDLNNHASVSVFLGYLKHLGNLRSLRLFVYDNELLADEHSDESQPLGLRTSTQALAREVLEGLSESCPQLACIVIDARHEDFHNRNDRQAGYLFIRQRDVSGSLTTTLSAIEPHLIKHHEPCSEILDDDVPFT